MSDTNKYSIFHINHHSPDRDLIGTMVINSYLEQFPDQKIIVVTHFPEVWIHNPDVYRVYKHGITPYFYDEYVKNKNSKIFAFNPEQTTEQITKKESLVETWSKMCGVKYNNSSPKIFLTQREEEVVTRITKSNNNNPIFLIAPYEMFKKPKSLPITWPKDLPIEISKKIVNIANVKNYNIIQLSNPNQMSLAGAVRFNFNLRLNFALIKCAEKIVCVDSFVQHVAKAFEKDTTVLWLSTNPNILGYSSQKNYSAKLNTELKIILDEYSSLLDFDCVRENLNINTLQNFDVDEIIKTIYE